MALTICPSIMRLLSVIVMGFSLSAHASTFYAGGEDGWTLDASENYTRWAESYRFQVNDEIGTISMIFEALYQRIMDL